jgi:hypothetical protein
VEQELVVVSIPRTSCRSGYSKRKTNIEKEHMSEQLLVVITTKNGVRNVARSRRGTTAVTEKFQ